MERGSLMNLTCTYVHEPSAILKCTEEETKGHYGCWRLTPEFIHNITHFGI
jgi:hypothetical protein